jgi:hypothetical protein
MSGPSRRDVAYGLAVVSGAVLFFLIFAAIFVGSWVLVIIVLLAYAGAGALRALLWPGIAAVAGGLGWVGGKTAAILAPRVR